jgi:hypothetical protein
MTAFLKKSVVFLKNAVVFGETMKTLVALQLTLISWVVPQV